MAMNKWEQEGREVRDLLNQISSMTNPELTPVASENRRHVRRGRVFPVLLAPWENESPVVDDAVYALTKDISEDGMALVLHSPYRTEQVVIGLMAPFSNEPEADPEPLFVLGNVCQNVSLGGSYWQLGIELTVFVRVNECPRLEKLVLPTKVVCKVNYRNLLEKCSMH